MEDIMVKNISIILLACIVFTMVAGCSGQLDEANSTPAVVPVASGDLRIVTGQRLYVPAYSEVYSASEDQT